MYEIGYNDGYGGLTPSLSMQYDYEYMRGYYDGQEDYLNSCRALYWFRE